MAERERLGGANVAPALRNLERTRELLARALDGEAHWLKQAMLEEPLLLAEAESRGAQALGQKAVAAVMEGQPPGPAALCA